jgi:hypothetical protein
MLSRTRVDEKRRCKNYDCIRSEILKDDKLEHPRERKLNQD